MDKTYLITIKNKEYATGAETQFEAEQRFVENILHDFEETDYHIKEVELDKIKNNKTIEFF